MKKFIILTVLAMVALAGSAWASPFLVADPYTGATYFKLLGLPGSPITVQPDTTNTYGFKWDAVALPAGSYTATAVACINDPTWGEACSGPSNPLSLTRPSAPTILPNHLRLSTQ